MNTVQTLIPPTWRRLKLPEHFVPTHQTSGLPHFGAVDCFAKPGTRVQVPETCELEWPHFIEWDAKNRVGGWTCYLHGLSGNTYFDTHFAMIAGPGTYAAGEIIGTVADVPHGWWAPHIHHAKHKGRYDPGV